MIDLTKNQTYSLLIDEIKNKSIKNKYIFTTKTKWYCLCCGLTIFVSYEQYGRNSIFCPICYPKMANKETIAQYQYMKKLKEQQLKLIESQIYNDI
jgi:hypothetical protein